MKAIARIFGLVWMLLCGAMWVWLGFAEPLGRVDGAGSSNWGLLTLISDNQFGLTMVPILLGGFGYALWSWGKDSNP
jgi:hypothetical protein